MGAQPSTRRPASADESHRCPGCGEHVWPEYMTAAEAATYIGCSERTVWNWRQSGSIPSVKVGGKVVRFPREALDAWIARDLQEAS